MAKKSEKVRNLTAEEAAVPVLQESMPEAERKELSAVGSAESVDKKDGEDGESGKADNRLPYFLRTREGQEAFLTLGKSIPAFLWVARARAVGHSLTADEVREVIAYDGPETVTCAAPSGQCAYRFQPIRMAYVNPDNGSLQTDGRLVSETNPTGISYRGAYLVVPKDPGNKYSGKKVIGPLCQHDQHSLMTSYRDAGWHVRLFGRCEAEAFVASENARQEKEHRAYLDNKNANAQAVGLLTRDGQRVERGGGRLRNNPHSMGDKFRLGDIIVSPQK